VTLVLFIYENMPFLQFTFLFVNFVNTLRINNTKLKSCIFIKNIKHFTSN